MYLEDRVAELEKKNAVLEYRVQEQQVEISKIKEVRLDDGISLYRCRRNIFGR